MKSREFNPLKLDVPAFVRSGDTLSGRWPLAELPRLAAGCASVPAGAPLPDVRWQARGEERRTRASAEPWLYLAAEVTLGLTCQRCLGTVEEPVRVERWFRFAESEERAAELDAESEDDVLAVSAKLDLRWLAEDELILAMPLVPRHAVCEMPAGTAPTDGDLAPGSGAEPPAAADPAPRGAGEAVSGDVAASQGDEPPRQRPFAGLGDLLKRRIDDDSTK